MEIKRGQVWKRINMDEFFKVVHVSGSDIYLNHLGVRDVSLVTEAVLKDFYTLVCNKGEFIKAKKPKEIIVKADKFTINDVEVDEAWIKDRIKERVGVVHPKENVLKKHNHYFKDVSDYKEIDVYALCKIFEIDDPSGCTQHAIKKLLVTGKRGHKDRLRDLQDVVDTVKRLIELESGNE